MAIRSVLRMSGDCRGSIIRRGHTGKGDPRRDRDIIMTPNLAILLYRWWHWCHSHGIFLHLLHFMMSSRNGADRVGSAAVG